MTTIKDGLAQDIIQTKIALANQFNGIEVMSLSIGDETNEFTNSLLQATEEHAHDEGEPKILQLENIEMLYLPQITKIGRVTYAAGWRPAMEPNSEGNLEICERPFRSVIQKDISDGIWPKSTVFKPK